MSSYPFVEPSTYWLLESNHVSMVILQRQRTVKKHKEDNVDQEYIEQQKAYFAEVDAFELQEEEVSSSDLD